MITTQRTRSGFAHQVEIAAPPAAVHAFLVDLDAQAGFHPLIESIEQIEPRPERPDARHHRVTDRISVGPFRFPVTYTAALESVSEHEIRGDAWQRPGIHLSTTYVLTGHEDGTRLVETVEVTAPRPLRRITVG